MKNSFLIAALMALMGAAALDSQVVSPAYYVSTSGNDTWTGLAATHGAGTTGPFATLTRAQTMMQSGGTKTVYVESGTYTLGAILSLGQSDAGESWLNYPGQAPVIDGANAYGIQISTPNTNVNIAIEGFTFQHMAMVPAGYTNNRMDVFIYGAQNVTLRWNTFLNCNDTCIIGNPATNAVIDSNTFNGSSPGDIPGQADATFAAMGFFYGTSGAQITHNSFTNLQGGAISFASSTGGPAVNNNIIDRNIITNSMLGGHDMGAIYIETSFHVDTGNQVTNNIIKNNPGNSQGNARAIYLDALTSNVLVKGNICSACGASGILIHGGDHNTVTNNIFDLSNPGTILNQLGFYQVNDPAVYTDYGMAGNTFQHNIIYSATTWPNPLWYNSVFADDTAPAVSNNLYYSVTGATLPTCTVTTPANTNTCIQDTSPVVSNPQFTNASAGNYAMPGGSPAFTSIGWTALPTDQGPLAQPGAGGGTGGALTATVNTAATTANLTAEGSIDWIHWGGASVLHKTTGASNISNYTQVGSTAPITYTNDPRALSWTDGTPTASGTDNNGLFITTLPNGFSFTAPADTTTKVLTVHAGTFSGGSTMTAHLSDSSAADYTNVTSNITGATDYNYTLTYTAASAGQTLTVTWVNTSGAGNVTLGGAALSLASSPIITATAGTPQSTIVSTAFSTALQATVTNAGSPVSGAVVTFTAPATGATATFSGTTSATATTNGSGVATAPALVANSQTGSFAVTAVTAGAASSVTFALSNTPSGTTPPPPSASSLSGLVTINGRANQTLDTLPVTHSANTVVWGCDGITASGNAIGSGPDQSFGSGWTAQATMLSKGKIQQLYNVGIPGNNTAQFLARFTSDVVNRNPGKVVILCGTSDIPTGVLFTATTLAPIVSNLTAMIDSANVNGIQPILCTVPPRNDTSIALTNSQILAQAQRQIAENRGITLVDFYAATADPSTGAYKSGYGKTDNITPSQQGALVMAQTFLAATANLFGPSQTYLPFANTEAINLMPNGLFLGALTPYSSTVYGTSPAPTFSTVTGSGTDVGNWMQVSYPVATSAGQLRAFNISPAITVTAGHTYALAFRFKISGLSENGGTLSVQMATSGVPQPMFSYTGDVTDGVFYFEQLASASATSWNPGFVVSPTTTASGNIVLQVAQIGLVDLTAISTTSGGSGGGGTPPTFIDPPVSASFTQAITAGGLLQTSDYEFGTGGGRNVTNATQLGTNFTPYGIAGTTVINQEWERYQPFSSALNFSFQPNSLDIVGTISQSGGSMTNGGINSGQVLTQQTFKPGVTGAYTYASEVYMQTPSGIGTWPASWYYVKNPGQTDTSEIDNPEFFYYSSPAGAQTKDTWTGFTHGPNVGALTDVAPGATGNTYTPGTVWSNGLHLYQTYWTPDAVYRYIDGVCITKTLFKWSAAGAGQLYVNLAIGSDLNFGTTANPVFMKPTSTSEFPSQTTLHLDHIKLWAK